MSDQQDPKPVSFGDPATEPVDLASAFKMYNEANRAAAQEPVDDPGSREGAGELQGERSGDGAASAGEPDDVQDAGADPAAPGQDGGIDPGDGGSADVIEPVDFDARRQELLQDIQRQAINEVRRDFSNNQINPCTIEELYQRDENSGRVTFKNPDDPQHDFASRAEAQAWVDAFNKQIEMRFRQEVNQKQRELVQQNAPTLRLIEFAPKFDQLSDVEKEIMDDLLEPYAIKNRAGDVVGFNVNLDAVANQAKKIAKRIPAQKAPEDNAGQNPGESENKASRPAMNMPTGNGKNADDKEPSSIGEALKMYDRSQREKGGRK